MAGMAPLLVKVVLELVILALAVSAAGDIYLILKGFFAAHRVRHRGPVRDDGEILLKSPLAPAISVVLAPTDASPASLALVHSLVKLHYGEHEVLLVLDDPD